MEVADVVRPALESGGARAGCGWARSGILEPMPSAQRLAAAGLQGWRVKLADALAEPASRHTPLKADQVRALVGGVFLALGVLYVIRAGAALARALRE